jgi:hypothetical protein
MPKRLPDADMHGIQQDGDVSSDPAGQDVSQELDAVHNPFRPSKRRTAAEPLRLGRAVLSETPS